MDRIQSPEAGSLSPAAAHVNAPATPAARALPAPDAAGVDLIATSVEYDAPPERVWEALMFYEQIEEPPPFLLRLLLPVPIRTEGRKTEVGDEARCLYEGGYLIKRVTGIVKAREYRFAVVEQALGVQRGVQLVGGYYTLTPLPGNRTLVETGTRYVSPKRPRWLWRPLESFVCHIFHRHILGAMRGALQRKVN